MKKSIRKWLISCALFLLCLVTFFLCSNASHHTLEKYFNHDQQAWQLPQPTQYSENSNMYQSFLTTEDALFYPVFQNGQYQLNKVDQTTHTLQSGVITLPTNPSSKLMYNEKHRLIMQLEVQSSKGSNVMHILLNTWDALSFTHQQFDLTGDLVFDLPYICSQSLDAEIPDDSSIQYAYFLEVMKNLWFFPINDDLYYLSTRVDLINDNHEGYELDRTIQSDYIVQINSSDSIQAFQSNRHWQKSGVKSHGRTLFLFCIYREGEFYLSNVSKVDDSLRIDHHKKTTLAGDWIWDGHRGDRTFGVHQYSEASIASLTNNLNYLGKHIVPVEDMFGRDTPSDCYATIIKYGTSYHCIFVFINENRFPFFRSLELGVSDANLQDDTFFDINPVNVVINGSDMWIYSTNTIANGTSYDNVFVRIDLVQLITTAYGIWENDGFAKLWKGVNVENGILNIYPCARDYWTAFDAQDALIPLPSTNGEYVYFFQNGTNHLWVMEIAKAYQYGQLVTPTYFLTTSWKNVSTIELRDWNPSLLGHTVHQAASFDWTPIIASHLDELYHDLPPDITSAHITYEVTAIHPLEGTIDCQINLKRVYWKGEIVEADHDLGGIITITGFQPQSPTPDTYQYYLPEDVEIKETNYDAIFHHTQEVLISMNLVPSNATIIEVNKSVQGKREIIYTLTTNQYWDAQGMLIEDEKTLIVTAISTHPSSYKNTTIIPGVTTTLAIGDIVPSLAPHTLNEIDLQLIHEYLFAHLADFFIDLPEDLVLSDTALVWLKTQSHPTEGTLAVALQLKKIYLHNQIVSQTLSLDFIFTGFQKQLPSRLNNITITLGSGEALPDDVSDLVSQTHDYLIAHQDDWLLPPTTTIQLILKSQYNEGIVLAASVDRYYDDEGWLQINHYPFNVIVNGFAINNSLPSLDDVTNNRFFRDIDLCRFYWLYILGIILTVVTIISIITILIYYYWYKQKFRKQQTGLYDNQDL